MWATRMLRTATAFKPMFGMSNPVRNYLSTMKPSFNDCTFMQLKCHSLVSNMFLHNVRELLENAELGEEACSLAEIVELSLLNQSKLIARIILGRMI